MPERLARILFAALFIFIASVRPVSAQTEGPVYIVQPGDTLFAIAGRFNLSVNDLIEANPSVDPGSLAVGQELVIPGLEGLTGRLELHCERWFEAACFDLAARSWEHRPSGTMISNWA